MDEKDRRKLEADCNSLNAIASYLRHCGKNGFADNLLAIEAHIFDVLDKTEEVVS